VDYGGLCGVLNADPGSDEIIARDGGNASDPHRQQAAEVTGKWF